MNTTLRSAAWVQALRTAWQQRPARERLWVMAGSALIALVLLWQVAIAPAWSVWREAPARQARLETQTRQMLQWQAEARQLQAPRRIERVEALRLLEQSATRLLGPGAQLSPQGDELRLTLKAAPASGLAQWLAQAREQAQARPRLVKLQKQEPTDSDTGVSWSGTLVLALP